jgi:methylenetetrahydrofolate dehydrogenase (NADP+)/methenyltetrahydrofolate cyclohydrolase
MGVLLDGKAIAAAVRAEVLQRVAGLTAAGVVPGLAVLLVGDDPASAIYVAAKVKACAELGIRSELVRLPATATQAEVTACLDRWNAATDVHGVLVQLPLPPHIATADVLARIATDKDVDGFGAVNLGLLAAGRPRLVACTPAGVMRILAFHAQTSGWQLRGRRALVIGRSLIVGRPMSMLLLNADATVTMAHSHTRDLAHHVAEAELVVAAAGVRHLVQAAWLRPETVVIDVGLHREADGRLTGDVEPAAMAHVAAMTPVPGGVGPMTIAMLMHNTVQACVASKTAG